MLRVREPHSASTALLRSYDSRKEPAPDVNCTIWEAGRATCATGLAFKPVQIGQSIYHDDGEGTYNPSPQILDEAIVNEWPGREVGVFVSVGTGKRPSDSSNANQHLWWESLAGGTMGDFAEARRKLFQKIEGCEDIHQAMIHEHLPARRIDPKVYLRLNVEVGVGDFKMNGTSLKMRGAPADITRMEQTFRDIDRHSRLPLTARRRDYQPRSCKQTCTDLLCKDAQRRYDLSWQLR